MRRQVLVTRHVVVGAVLLLWFENLKATIHIVLKVTIRRTSMRIEVIHLGIVRIIWSGSVPRWGRYSIVINMKESLLIVIIRYLSRCLRNLVRIRVVFLLLLVICMIILCILFSNTWTSVIFRGFTYHIVLN